MMDSSLHFCLVCLCCSLMSCQSADRSGPSTDRPTSLVDRFENVENDVDYIGDDACASCHEDLYHGYRDHGMANSVYRLSDSTAAATYPGDVVYDSTRNLHYRAYRDGDAFYQEEYRLNRAGERVHHLVREMTFVVGSGSAAHTYLTEHENRYYELPLTWYTQEERWDFSPGYREGNQRFNREIPDRCMACHNSYPESVPFASGKFRSMPEGIGCERCHGPGELHADERLVSMEAPDSIDYTIVNPAHLPMDRRMDVCQQCHLHGTVSLLRDGREPFDYRPAEPLAAHVSLFSTPDEQTSQDNDIAVISHADRLRNSACFTASLESSRPMDCVTCHNPHEGFRSSGADYFNTTCRDCHGGRTLEDEFARPDLQQQHTAAGNCIECHMPKVPAEDAPHASFTDHQIRVVEDSASPDGSRSPVVEVALDSVELEAYFPRDQTREDGQIYRGMAYVVYGMQKGNQGALRRGAELLEDALDNQNTYGEAYFQLGLAYRKLGQNQRAISSLERALQIDSEIPERLNALARAYEADGRDTSKIGALYRHALELQPAAAEIRVNYGRFLEVHGRLRAARMQYEKAVEEDSWSAVGHYNLGTVYLREGRTVEAERELERAIELRPDYAEALTNLGTYLAEQDRPEEARKYLERAVEAAPNHTEALTNLGLFYVLHDRPREAVPVLRRAIRGDGGRTDALANLGFAYFRLEEYDRARRYAERALSNDASHQLARQIVQATGP